MDVGSAVDDGFGDRFAGAATAVEDGGGGGQLGEVFLDDFLDTGVVAIDRFVLGAVIGPELWIGVHGLRWLRVFHDDLEAKWFVPRISCTRGLWT